MCVGVGVLIWNQTFEISSPFTSCFTPFYPPRHSSHLHRFQDLSHPIKMRRTDQALPRCSRTRHCLPKTATIRWRARWALPIGRLLTTLLRGGIDYPTITPALSLVLLRLPPLHQMEMNPTTATQSKSGGSSGVLSVIDHQQTWFLPPTPMSVCWVGASLFWLSGCAQLPS